MSPEDLKQITDAMEQLDWVQWVKTQMQGAAPAVDPVMEPAIEPAPALDAAPALPPAAPAIPPAAPAPSPVAEPDDSLPLKYSRLSGEVTTLRGTVEKLHRQLEDERGRRVNTERYAALADTRRTRLFDLDGEFELVKYGRMSDEQFTTHLERINANYREIPLDMNVPTFDLPAHTSAARPGGKAAKERYSKDVSDRALAIAKRKAMAGESVSYEEVLEQVANGEAA
jgi:hypothetical protein